MASIEVELDDAIPRLERRDGRFVIVFDDGTNEAVLQLPIRDPHRPLHRLSMASDKFRDEVRAEATNEYSRPARIISAADPAR